MDGISAPNQTNLALKGVIGIAAMGSISTLLGQTQDAYTYNVNYSFDLFVNSPPHLLCEVDS